MRIFRTIAIPTIAVVLAAIGGATFIVQGAFDVSARSPHWGITTAFLEAVRDRSISVRATGITPPSGFDDRPHLAQGIVHYRAHCATCHGAPGIEPEEIAAGMYPKPPSLHQATGRSAAEVFWIVKNGIKMSGMPAWGSDHGDEELWPVVALVVHLPQMSGEDYAKLGAEADGMGDGNHHHGMETSTPAATPVAEAEVPAHRHDGHSHSHSHSHPHH